jgi:hypothetical protein
MKRNNEKGLFKSPLLFQQKRHFIKKVSDIIFLESKKEKVVKIVYRI